MVLMADLCVDEYTSHGHCGIVTEQGEVDNDATLQLYERAAVAQADAGADVTAPSGMMDVQLPDTRAALAGARTAYKATPRYSAQYAAAHYGPFRDRSEERRGGEEG